MGIFAGLFGFIGSVFGYVLWGAFLITKNFGLAIILFTIVAKIVMFPTSIKQQKSMAGNARLQAKQQELKEKYGNDKAKYNEELSKLYEQQGNPMSGCLTSLLPMLLMLGIFYSVAYPITNTLHINGESVQSAIDFVRTIPGVSVSTNTVYEQIEFIKVFPSISGTSVIKGLFTGAEIGKMQMFSQGFNLVGVDLLGTPRDFGFSVLLLIPILSFVTSLSSQLVMTKLSGNPAMQQQQGCMKFMLYLMPLITAYFSYTVPAAVGFYWIVSNVIGFAQSLVMNKFYSPGILTAKSEAQHIALLKTEEALVKREYNPTITSRKRKK